MAGNARTGITRRGNGSARLRTSSCARIKQWPKGSLLLLAGSESLPLGQHEAQRRARRPNAGPAFPRTVGVMRSRIVAALFPAPLAGGIARMAGVFLDARLAAHRGGGTGPALPPGGWRQRIGFDFPPEFQAKVGDALPGILTTGGAHAQEQVFR